MTSSPGFTESLVMHFERIHEQHMRGLPILNPALEVEVACVRDDDEKQACILITPWFMNLVVRSVAGSWDTAGEGERVSVDLPRESLEFTVCRDVELGTYLSAVLFRTTIDFPDQQTARETARETMRQLFSTAAPARQRKIGRRALLTGMGSN